MRLPKRTLTGWLVISMALCAAAGIGCARSPKVVYLEGGDRVVHIEQGVPAPFTGWLMTDEKLAEIFEMVEDRSD